ncbi:hypothetical protein FB562_1889 [Homoserinimonas aerilata]|uniref:Uncharacterized protein n=1 Tax=Homoserinimonas aerilata TaxID=1162970 RepID=A0A542YL34_9MICO|nr:hypothetical protein FB562_1889 [Homoserinimonas aerilata]
MSARSEVAVAQLADAAARLEVAAAGNPLPQAVATLLRAQVAYWRMWFPEAPSARDRALVQLARAVIATYPAAPGADAGPRQHINTEKKGSARG